MAKTAEKHKAKRNVKKNVITGIVCIASSFNNTIVTVTDLQGNTIAWSSAGQNGFNGSRKSTPYAAQVTTDNAIKKAMVHGLKYVSVEIKGSGSGRESAVRALQTAGLTVTSITDVTPIPHNGCRPSKRRRV